MSGQGFGFKRTGSNVSQKGASNSRQTSGSNPRTPLQASFSNQQNPFQIPASRHEKNKLSIETDSQTDNDEDDNRKFDRTKRPGMNIQIGGLDAAAVSAALIQSPQMLGGGEIPSQFLIQKKRTVKVDFEMLFHLKNMLSDRLKDIVDVAFTKKKSLEQDQERFAELKTCFNSNRLSLHCSLGLRAYINKEKSEEERERDAHMIREDIDQFPLMLFVKKDGNSFYRSCIVRYMLGIVFSADHAKLEKFLVQLRGFPEFFYSCKSSQTSKYKKLSDEEIKAVFTIFLVKQYQKAKYEPGYTIEKFIENYNADYFIDFAAVIVLRIVMFETYKQFKWGNLCLTWTKNFEKTDELYQMIRYGKEPLINTACLASAGLDTEIKILSYKEDTGTLIQLDCLIKDYHFPSTSLHVIYTMDEYTIIFEQDTIHSNKGFFSPLTKNDFQIGVLFEESGTKQLTQSSLSVLKTEHEEITLEFDDDLEGNELTNSTLSEGGEFSDSKSLDGSATKQKLEALQNLTVSSEAGHMQDSLIETLFKDENVVDIFPKLQVRSPEEFRLTKRTSVGDFGIKQPSNPLLRKGSKDLGEGQPGHSRTTSLQFQKLKKLTRSQKIAQMVVEMKPKEVNSDDDDNEGDHNRSKQRSRQNSQNSRGSKGRAAEQMNSYMASGFHSKHDSMAQRIDRINQSRDNSIDQISQNGSHTLIRDRKTTRFEGRIEGDQSPRSPKVPLLDLQGSPRNNVSHNHSIHRRQASGQVPSGQGSYQNDGLLVPEKSSILKGILLKSSGRIMDTQESEPYENNKGPGRRLSINGSDRSKSKDEKENDEGHGGGGDNDDDDSKSSGSSGSKSKNSEDQAAQGRVDFTLRCLDCDQDNQLKSGKVVVEIMIGVILCNKCVEQKVNYMIRNGIVKIHCGTTTMFRYYLSDTLVRMGDLLSEYGGSESSSNSENESSVSSICFAVDRSFVASQKLLKEREKDLSVLPSQLLTSNSSLQLQQTQRVKQQRSEPSKDMSRTCYSCEQLMQNEWSKFEKFENYNNTKTLLLCRWCLEDFAKSNQTTSREFIAVVDTFVRASELHSRYKTLLEEPEKQACQFFCKHDKLMNRISENTRSIWKKELISTCVEYESISQKICESCFELLLLSPAVNMNEYVSVESQRVLFKKIFKRDFRNELCVACNINCSQRNRPRFGGFDTLPPPLFHVKEEISQFDSYICLNCVRKTVDESYSIEQFSFAIKQFNICYKSLNVIFSYLFSDGTITLIKRALKDAARANDRICFKCSTKANASKNFLIDLQKANRSICENCWFAVQRVSDSNTIKSSLRISPSEYRQIKENLIQHLTLQKHCLSCCSLARHLILIWLKNYGRFAVICPMCAGSVVHISVAEGVFEMRLDHFAEDFMFIQVHDGNKKSSTKVAEICKQTILERRRVPIAQINQEEQEDEVKSNYEFEGKESQMKQSKQQNENQKRVTSERNIDDFTSGVASAVVKYGLCVVCADPKKKPMTAPGCECLLCFKCISSASIAKPNEPEFLCPNNTCIQMHSKVEMIALMEKLVNAEREAEVQRKKQAKINRQSEVTFMCSCCDDQFAPLIHVNAKYCECNLLCKPCVARIVREKRCRKCFVDIWNVPKIKEFEPAMRCPSCLMMFEVEAETISSISLEETRKSVVPKEKTMKKYFQECSNCLYMLSFYVDLQNQ